MYPADPGSNPVVSMLQRALRLSVSAGRQTQLIMNRSCYTLVGSLEENPLAVKLLDNRLSDFGQNGNRVSEKGRKDQYLH